MQRRPFLHLLVAITVASSACAGPTFGELDLAGLDSLCPEAAMTGDLSSCNGTYYGVMTIEATRAEGALNSTCTGEMTVTIDADATPAVQGHGECEFDGLLSSMGVQEGLVDGRLDSSDLLAGEVWVGRDLRTQWDGGWSSEGALRASFQGDHEVSGIELEYRGTFEVWR